MVILIVVKTFIEQQICADVCVLAIIIFQKEHKKGKCDNTV